MPIEAVKIPQNVYVEDRIIGPITLRQLFVTGIGAGISYVLFSYTAKAGLGLPFKVGAWIPALIAAMFAFLKINDLSLLHIILLIIEGINKPSQRYWSPSPGLSINLVTRESKASLDAAQAKAIETARKLAEMTAELERRQRELSDITLSAPEVPEVSVSQSAERSGPTASEQFELQAAPVSPAAGSSDRAEEDISSLPVNPRHISITALDPKRSIDTICQDIPTYLGFHS